MARAVGLDIGSRTIKLVELGGNPKALKVQRLAIRDVPTPGSGSGGGEGAEGGGEPDTRDPEELVADTIRGLFEDLKLPKEDVCATFDAGTTIFREITVPFRDEDQIRKVVKFEAENHLHSRSIDDVVVNWVKTGETRDGSRLMIMASPKEELTRRLAILRRAGIDPASIDLDATAVYTACHAAGVFERNPNVIVLEVGARTTNLMLVLDGRPRLLRSFLLGTEALAAGISRELEVPIEEGRRQSRAAAGRPDDLLVPLSVLERATTETEKSLAEVQGEAVGDKRAEFVRKLHRESVRSLAAVPAESPPDRILVCGGGSLLPGVREALAERFGLPVDTLDLGERVTWRGLGEDEEFAKAACVSAVGCGLRMLGVNPLGIELLREEFTPTNLFDVIKVPLAWAVTLLFVVFLGLAYAGKRRLDAETTRFNNIYAQVQQMYKVPEMAYLQAVKNKPSKQAAEQEMNAWLRALPQDHLRIEAIRRHLLSRHRELQGSLGLAKDVPPVPSAVQVWYEAYKDLSSVPREQLGSWFRVTRMDITVNQATIGIEVADEGTLDVVQRIFEKSPYFRGRAKRANEVVSRAAVRPQAGRLVTDFMFRFKDED
jgi:type IV pilus assembly protein PilM